MYSDLTGRDPQSAGATPRFGRLTYTSFTAQATSGASSRTGWQIKDRTPDLSEAEQNAMVGWVTDHIEPATPASDFPDEAEIERLPRRFTYARLPIGAVYAHAVPAGSDRANRRGNVFSHLVLDRAPADPTLRPIELWRSPEWLTPHGQDAIDLAVLPNADGPPRRGAVVHPDSVLDFLFAGAGRVAVLQVLLDAVANALTGGPRIVLAVPDPDAAALWIGAVGYFAAGSSAAGLHWSTFERAESALNALNKGLHLVAVPTADSDRVAEDGTVIVLDTMQLPQRGQFPRTEHRTHRGTAVPVREWSALVDSTLASQEIAARAIEGIDRLGAELAGIPLPPAWPLAAVITGSPGQDGHELARQVFEEQTPPEVRSNTRILSLVAGFLAPGLGLTADDAWRQLLDSAGAGATTRQIFWNTMVVRALRDHAWLGSRARPFAEHCPAGIEPDPDIRATAVESVQSLAASAWPAEQLTRTALRLLELVRSAAITDDAVTAPLDALLRRDLPPLLAEPGRGAAFVRETGAIAEPIRVGQVLPAVALDAAIGARPLGSRFEPEVTAWLAGPEYEALATGRQAPIRAADPVAAVIADRVFRTVATGGPVDPGAAATALLRAVHEHAERGWGPADVPGLLRTRALDDARLREIDRAQPGLLPPRFLLDRLLGAAGAEEGAAIARTIRRRQAATADSLFGGDPADITARRWAWLEHYGRDWRLIKQTSVDKLVPLLDDYARRSPTALPHRLATALGIVLLCARSQRRTVAIEPGSAHEHILLDALADRADDVEAALLTLVDRGSLGPNWVCALAALAAARVHSAPAELTPLAQLRSGYDSPILEGVAARLLADPVRYGAPMSRTWLATAVEEKLAELAVHEADRRIVADFVRTWQPGSLARAAANGYQDSEYRTQEYS